MQQSKKSPRAATKGRNNRPASQNRKKKAPQTPPGPDLSAIEIPTSATGILQIGKQGNGYLRDPELSFEPTPADVLVPVELIRKYALIEGAEVSGPVQRSQGGQRGPELAGVDTICGLDPAAFVARTRFERLVAVDPTERFRVGDSGIASMRVMELMSPIGKGTRGLIVAPPKSGKTILLEEIARGADDESEMGAFHDLFQPQRVANLRARLAEYVPAGMEAAIIFAS